MPLKVSEDSESYSDGDEETWQPENWEEEIETLSTTGIPTETTGQNQEEYLHRYYKELQEAHIIKQQRFALELQAERRTNEPLQDELEKLRASYNEISKRYEADNLRSKQQATHLKAELENKVKSH
ncbi:unnamed protein product [Pleuronectes platessa]|uniref:Uncharacterized protein n=1 Tax=Pleuronectes platessa TaxID=8262 RepID=A0A9N7UAV5_PLEPL|nr:unnamed protein product [Pleuronectes platessa]